jgi:hypothetical protein
MAKQRQLTNLQKKILTFMLSADCHFPGLFPAQYINKSLRNNCVYSSCNSLAAAGLVYLQRKPNRRVFIGLTDAGRTMAASLMPVEYRQHREAGTSPPCRPLQLQRPRRVSSPERVSSVVAEIRRKMVFEKGLK